MGEGYALPCGARRVLFSRNALGNTALASIQDFDRTVERIAHPPFRDDEPGLRGIGFKLAAQPGHLNVDRAVIHLVVVHATRLEELVAREDPLRGGEQGGEQVELAIRQINGSPVAVLEAPRSQVELE